MRDNAQKAQLFAAYLANTFQPHVRQTADEYVCQINNKDETNLKPETTKEVSSEIDKNQA